MSEGQVNISEGQVNILEAIRAKMLRGEFEFSQHATDQSIRRWITVQELREAMQAPELIEDYPDAKYGPSCLIPGFTNSGRPLHIHCSHASREIVKIITLYEPSPSIWLGFKRRRKANV